MSASLVKEVVSLVKEVVAKPVYLCDFSYPINWVLIDTILRYFILITFFGDKMAAKSITLSSLMLGFAYSKRQILWVEGGFADSKRKILWAEGSTWQLSWHWKLCLLSRMSRVFGLKFNADMGFVFRKILEMQFMHSVLYLN